MHRRKYQDYPYLFKLHCNSTRLIREGCHNDSRPPTLLVVPVVHHTLFIDFDRIAPAVLGGMDVITAKYSYRPPRHEIAFNLVQTVSQRLSRAT